ncbi:Uncharacterised protein [Candidatus Bilamarchaeum dharawalense]|uniref:Uncharacterized protein n=1 Tax=Candidatus Bilamarchaeum dharawalense TaxID=2885759 RepID=A0A5E4LRI9_9ARCH|nr:Uncharacterised protein [Candidatus Bilamarchaeum dharawalense]
MKNFFILLLLISVIYSYSTNAHFVQPSFGYSTDTDLQLTTDFTASLASGEILEGNPNDLQTGDIVCAGARIKITPQTNAKWAVSDFDSTLDFPYCDPGYDPWCPSMTGESLSTNKNIHWLTSSRFNWYVNEFDTAPNDYLLANEPPSSDVTDIYEELSPFSNEPVTYIVWGEDPQNNKEAGAGVYCKGTLSLDAAGTTNTQSPTSTASLTSGTLNTPGDYNLETQLEDVDCFAAVVKHPVNLYDGHADFFYLHFYVTNRPNIPSVTASKTISVEVQEAGGTCSIALAASPPIDVTYSGDYMMVKVPVKNNGDSVNLTGVTSTNGDYTASPFPGQAICATLGFPPAICPPVNGFNNPIASGGTRLTYVLLHDTTPGPSGGTTLVYSAVATSTGCGGTSECSLSVTALNGAIDCDIASPDYDPPAPPSDIPQNLNTRFNVTCTDLDMTPIACSGSNWDWAPAWFGTFTFTSNSYARGYPTASPGADGQIRYTSGIATCTEDIHVLPDITTPVNCSIVPSSAELAPMEWATFTVTCINSIGDTIPCNGSNWYWGDGLAGGFIDKDETHADAYSTSPPGSSGTLSYSSGLANCSSAVSLSTDSPYYLCELVPESVTINQSTSQHFTLSTFLDGAPHPADLVGYTMINGLTGTLSNDTITGVDYTAPPGGTEGDIQVVANFTDAPDPIGGCVDFSHVFVPDVNAPTSCEMVPTNLTMAPLELAAFTVTCENFFGNPVPCIGDNWFWGDGLTGDFVEKDETHANAYSTSPVGSTGKLFYSSMLANCSSNVTIDFHDGYYGCDLTPDSVSLNYSDSQHFNFACTVNGTDPATPDDTDYQLVDGLIGSVNGNLTGVDYDAPDENTSGNLLGVGYFNDAPPPYLGAVDLSHISVSNMSGPCVGPDCNPGDTLDCRILAPYPLVIPTGYHGWYGIRCGVDGTEICPAMNWVITPGTAGYITSGDYLGAWFTINGHPGSIGEIHASFESDPSRGCSRPFEIGTSDCWEFS